MKNRIYLDNAASTPVDPEVIEAMLPFYSETFGNASSMHHYGSKAKDALNDSRSIIASSINAAPEEIIFTSSGTEANNMALKGVASASKKKGRHIIVSSIEHDCILNTAKWLQEQGFEISYLPVGHSGLIEAETLENAIRPDTILVSVMHANNEIGTVQPIETLGRICKQNNILFHSDACQSFGKITIDVHAQHIDLLSLNAHKIYGPKGIGALFIRKGTNLHPLLHGGGQEFGLRSSTENIPAIVGFAKAVELCKSSMVKENNKMLSMRNLLVDFLKDNFEDFYINGSMENRLYNNLNFSFHGLEGESIRLLLMLDDIGIAVSAGSACSSNSKSSNSSHVLQAIGLNPFEAKGAVRVSFGRFNTMAEVESFGMALIEVVGKLTSIFS